MTLPTPHVTLPGDPAMRMKLLPLALACLLPFASAQGAPPSKDEVVAMVKKAVAYYQANGREKTLADFNKKDGPFSKGEDYVDVHDTSGTCVAHPITPALVGMNRIDEADAGGKYYIKELTDAAKKQGSGWIEYVKKNPTNGKLQNKMAYWEVKDGLIFKAGTYSE
jgi:cytochrome c